MKCRTLAMACVLLLATVSAQAFAPSPVSIALTVGQWLIKDQKKIYYVEVQSRGPTLLAAKDEGFRLAVEHAVGSLTSSESTVRNGKLVNKEIIAYSSGFVERFEIVEREDLGTGVQLTMKIWVSHSAIADRLLHQSRVAGLVDGSQAGAAVQTKLTELQTGDRLLKSVLADYPRRAFDIDLKPTRIMLDNQRRVIAEVAYNVRWNKTYIRSLEETLEAVANNRRIYNHVWDADKFAIIWSSMVQDRVVIRVAIRDDHNRILAKQCSFPDAHSNTGDWFSISNSGPYASQFRVYTASTGTAKEYLYLGTNAQLLETAGKVDIQAVRQSDC